MLTTKHIEQSIQKIKLMENHDNQFVEILKTYLELFPVLDVALYRYSPLGFLTEGIIAMYPEEGFVQIRHVRDDVRTVPAAYIAIRTRIATMVTDEELIKHSHRYVLPPETTFLSFSPISFRSSVVGLIASSRFSVSKDEVESLIPLFTYYGELIGEILEKPYSEGDQHYYLKKREVEVMQLLSLGETTDSIAELIHLSEFTIKDYIKSTLKKIGVNNRTHAIATLIRHGIIS